MKLFGRDSVQFKVAVIMLFAVPAAVAYVVFSALAVVSAVAASPVLGATAAAYAWKWTSGFISPFAKALSISVPDAADALLATAFVACAPAAAAGALEGRGSHGWTAAAALAAAAAALAALMSVDSFARRTGFRGLFTGPVVRTPLRAGAALTACVVLATVSERRRRRAAERAENERQRRAFHREHIAGIAADRTAAMPQANASDKKEKACAQNAFVARAAGAMGFRAEDAFAGHGGGTCSQIDESNELECDGIDIVCPGLMQAKSGSEYQAARRRARARERAFAHDEGARADGERRDRAAAAVAAVVAIALVALTVGSAVRLAAAEAAVRTRLPGLRRLSAHLDAAAARSPAWVAGGALAALLAAWVTAARGGGDPRRRR